MEKMSYENFVLKMKTSGDYYLRNHPGLSLRFVRVPKINYTEEQVTLNGVPFAPSLSLAFLYQSYLRENTFESTMREMVLLMLKEKKEKKELKENFQKDLLNLKNLSVALINKKANLELLKNIPYRDFLDLAIIYHFVVYDKEGNDVGKITVTNDILKTLDMDESKLYEIAVPNSIKVSQPVFSSVNIFGFGPPIWMITNASKKYGAAAILQKKVLDEAANVTASDIYLLPSSLHEFLFLPVTEESNVHDLKNMIKEVNETVLRAEEYLSDSLYKYCRDTGELTIVSD